MIQSIYRENFTAAQKGDFVLSFTRERRLEIQQYLLDKISSKDPSYIKRTCEAFQISDKTVYRYLKEMESAGLLEKNGRTYTLHDDSHTWVLKREEFETAGEDRIYANTILPLLKSLPQNVREIWDYAFTEMMNNAIDHANANHVEIVFQKNALHTIVIISDDGIGIFKNIKEFFQLNTIEDAIEQLFKGKLTTDASRHSGEGIFFTSRMLDQFGAVSDGLIFSHDQYDDIVHELKKPTVLPDWNTRAGTIIYMKLSNNSNRNSVDIFDRYADVDNGFTRTHIPLKNLYDTYPVSRSQAKRLCRNLDKFTEVELDFSGVEKIGQGFAHELFVVYQNEHPTIRLLPINQNETVARMIQHVLR